MDTLVAAGHRLEYARTPAAREGAPTLVFLHEGLGSLGLWRDFPSRVAAATGAGTFVYSRWGYGGSDAITPPRPVRYMHDEALLALPEVLAEARVRDPILVGHSDGASIALIYAGSPELAPRPRALVLLAPHVFVEDVSVTSIAASARAYREGDLAGRLRRWHGDNTDGAFWGWNRVWLDPAFRAWNIEEYLPRVTAPVLVVQGEDDEYGTLRQVDAIEAQCAASVERVVLAACGHSPQRDQPDATLAAITAFVQRVRHPIG